MGRWSYSSRIKKEDCISVNVFSLKKFGFFSGFFGGSLSWTYPLTGNKSSIGVLVSTLENKMYVEFEYIVTKPNGEKKKIDYRVPLVTTPCNYGGIRYWFICPISVNGRYCGRRVAKLYKPPGSDYFACRHCYNLTYTSRNENPKYRNSIYAGIEAIFKAEELDAQIKKRHYAGKPTRQQRKIDKLYRKAYLCSLLAKEKGLL